MNSKNLIKISALTLVAGLSVGCASTGSVAKVEDEARRAQATASEAQATANQALDAANQAKTMASDANSRTMAMEERMNRMFKRSMYK